MRKGLKWSLIGLAALCAISVVCVFGLAWYWRGTLQWANIPADMVKVVSTLAERM